MEIINKVKLCAVASGFPEIKAALNDMGIDVIEVEPLETLQKPIANHADMQLHCTQKGRAVVAKGAVKLIKELKSRGFYIEEQILAEKYPDDVALNCFCLNKKLFCNIKSVSKLLLNYYQSIGTEIISVNQGYTKCSTVIVSDDSIITADESIVSAARNNGIDVLQIQSGGISLSGYDTGFIGGCCGLVSPDILVFTGRLSDHSSAADISSFCKSKRVEIIELTNSELIDIGGILPLAI